MRRTWLQGTAFVFAAALVGCATENVGNIQTENSVAAISSAEQVGAAKVPAAALHLQMAKEEADRGKNMMANGEKENANSMLLRAEADANLAVAEAHHEQARVDAAQALDRVRQLKQQNQLP